MEWSDLKPDMTIEFLSRGKWRKGIVKKVQMAGVTVTLPDNSGFFCNVYDTRNIRLCPTPKTNPSMSPEEPSFDLWNTPKGA